MICTMTCKGDPSLCRKALELNKKLDGSSDFKTNTGWDGIREINEKLVISLGSKVQYYDIVITTIM